MLLVLSVVALVAVMGLAMLGEASVQSQTGRNTQAAAAAEALAESGADLACYYLMNPQQAPSLSDGYWHGGNGITIGGVNGSVDVGVLSIGNKDYSITATGRSGLSGASTPTRTVSITVRVERGLEVKVGAAFSTAVLTAPASLMVDGDVQVNGALTNLGTINGTAYATSATNSGTLLGGWLPLSSDNQMQVPTAANLRNYQTYTYGTSSYTATDLGASIAAGTVLGPTPTNPAGIYRHSGALSIGSNVTINGTLLVSGGPLNVTGSNSVITPMHGYPGAVVTGDVYLRGPGTRNLTVNGMSWVGGGLKSSGVLTSSYLTFHGALLMGGGGTVDALFGGKVNVYPDAESVSGVDLDVTLARPGVQVKSFTD